MYVADDFVVGEWTASAVRPDVRFDHSTFRPGLISTETLRKKSPLFTPQLSPKGQALLEALRLCNGQRSLAEIENEVSANYADNFTSTEMLSAFIAEELDRWGL